MTESVEHTRRTIGIMLLELTGRFPGDRTGDLCVGLIDPLIQWLLSASDPAWEKAHRVGKVP